MFVNTPQPLALAKAVCLLAMWAVVLFWTTATAQAAQVTLAWDPSTSSNVGGYHLVYGQASKSYNAEIDVGNQTSYTVTNLEASGTYYFAVHAYDTTRTIESDNSNEVSLDTTLAADFTANPTTGMAPLQVTVSDNSSGNVTKWFWDFGDGNTSSDQNPPAHTYANAKNYQVTLTVGDSLGSTRSKSIVVTAQAPASTPLPSPWQNQDVGAVGLAGSTDYANGVFTLNGSGADIGSNTDAFQFIYQPWNGDGVFVARVTSITNTDPQAKVGLMIRESLDASARNAMVLAVPTYQVSFQSRAMDGGTTNSKSNKSTIAMPWLKLVRTGATVTAYQSSNRRTWKQVGSATINMKSDVLVGLAVTSHNNGALNTATLNNVSMAFQ